MLTGIHILLSYRCTFECDHCFLHSSPQATGTMTSAQVRQVLDEARNCGSVEWIYFEGGEPTLFYPTLVEGVRLAKEMGFKVGIVSNAYLSNSEEDAELWLRPLHRLSLDHLSISDDAFHHSDEQDNPARRALSVAEKLGIPTAPICIQKPFVEAAPGEDQTKGQPVIGGGAMFKGRAAEKLTAGLPRRPCSEFTRCQHEELVSPSRVHVDPFGHVHLCQGVSMGNMWQRPLSVLLAEYKADDHPICGPLVKGGPALLAKQYNVDHEETYVDECHLCYHVRRALVDRFPEYLAPRQVYGL
jgi:hypothetical protein